MYALISYVSSQRSELPPAPVRPPLPKVHPVKTYNVTTVSYDQAQQQANINFQLKVKEIVKQSSS